MKTQSNDSFRVDLNRIGSSVLIDNTIRKINSIYRIENIIDSDDDQPDLPSILKDFGDSIAKKRSLIFAPWVSVNYIYNNKSNLWTAVDENDIGIYTTKDLYEKYLDLVS